MTTATKTATPKTPTLWELSAEVTSLMAQMEEIAEADDLTAEEVTARLQSSFDDWMQATGDFEKKAEGVAHYIKHLEAITEARSNEAHRIRNLADQTDRQAQRLRDYLTLHMAIANKKSIKGTTCNISLRKKPERVLLNCEPEELPEQFQKVTIAAKLTEIKAYLKTNKQCSFAFMSQTQDYSLMIK